MKNTKRKQTLQSALESSGKIREALEHIANRDPVQKQHKIDFHKQRHILTMEAHQIKPDECAWDRNSMLIVLAE
jgi:hypothetical protein